MTPMDAATTSETALSAAFDLVCPRKCLERWAARDQRITRAMVESRSWRDQISALVTDADLAAAGVTIEQVAEAVAHYTATSARITRQQIAGRAGETFAEPLPGYLVLADGYRAGPAGP